MSVTARWFIMGTLETDVLDEITETVTLVRYMLPRCQVHGDHDAAWEITCPVLSGYGCDTAARGALAHGGTVRRIVREAPIEQMTWRKR